MTFPSKAINITAHDLNRACQARFRHRRSHQKPDNQAKTLARLGLLKFSALHTTNVATAVEAVARSPCKSSRFAEWPRSLNAKSHLAKSRLHCQLVFHFLEWSGSKYFLYTYKHTHTPICHCALSLLPYKFQ